MSRAEDADLVKACLEGEADAFGALVDQYQKAVYNAAYRLVNDPEDAKDVSQTTFIKVYENLSRYDPAHKLYSWIYRIAVNEALNLLHRKNRLEPLDREREAEGRSPEAMLAAEEAGRHVQDALMRLKVEYRTVIVLRHFLDCSYEEIAEIVRVPVKTVKSRLFSARQLLKESLAEKGILA